MPNLLFSQKIFYDHTDSVKSEKFCILNFLEIFKGQFERLKTI